MNTVSEPAIATPFASSVKRESRSVIRHPSFIQKLGAGRKERATSVGNLRPTRANRDKSPQLSAKMKTNPAYPVA